MHLRSRRARLLVAASTLLVPVSLMAGVQTASAAPVGGMVANRSTLPRWLPTTKAKIASKAAPADTHKTLSVRVFLAPRGGAAALNEAALAVSTPGSATYGQFISADQFHASYAPTAASEKSVRKYLKGQGLKVTQTAPFRRYVTAKGTVAQLDKAFGVTLQSFSHLGQKVLAPTTAAQLPAKVAKSVLTIDGLDTTRVQMTRHASPKTDPPAGFRNAKPCSRFYGQVAATKQSDFKTPLPKFQGTTLSYAPCGYTGPQYRSAYEGDTTLTGAGTTVAITDAYRWQLIASDAEQYAAQHGDGSYAAGQLTENLPSGYNSEDACDPSGWSGEETLDVEAVHAMAPGANIRYYASSSCNDDDFLDTLARVTDEGVAQVVSNSWGDAGEVTSSDAVTAYEAVFDQAALQGISVLFSSGDNGDELQNTGLKQADYPATEPMVTAVGGTATGIGGDGKRVFDTGWGTETYSLAKDAKSWTSGGYLYGAGGGVSSLFNQPSYQRGVVAPQLAGGRAVPDVAMDADPQTGMLVGQTQKFSDGTYYSEYRIGGTSLASPLLAGMTALAVQNNKGHGFGLLNPVVYKRSSLVDDVLPVKAPDLGVVRVNYVNSENTDAGLSYSVRTFGQDSSLAVTKGWDQVTGRGVPNVSYLKMTTPVTAPTTVAAR